MRTWMFGASVLFASTLWLPVAQASVINLDKYVPNYDFNGAGPFIHDVPTDLDYTLAPAPGWSGSGGVVENGKNIITVPYPGAPNAAWVPGHTYQLSSPLITIPLMAGNTYALDYYIGRRSDETSSNWRVIVYDPTCGCPLTVGEGNWELAGDTSTLAPGTWSALQTLTFTPAVTHTNAVVYLASYDVAGNSAGAQVFFDPLLVPEPGTLALIGLGLIVLGRFKRDFHG